MKHIVFTLCCLLCAARLSSAQVINGSFQDITGLDRINFVVNYSGSTIMGMSEEQFRLYEEDWIKDQPEIYSKIRDAINEKMKGKLAVGVLKESPYTLFVKVISISKKGEFLTNLYLIQNTDDGKEEQIGIAEGVKTKNKYANSYTKLHTIKRQAGVLGSKIASLLLKEYKKKQRYFWTRNVESITQSSKGFIHLYINPSDVCYNVKTNKTKEESGFSKGKTIGLVAGLGGGLAMLGLIYLISKEQAK